MGQDLRNVCRREGKGRYCLRTRVQSAFIQSNSPSGKYLFIHEIDIENILALSHIICSKVKLTINKNIYVGNESVTKHRYHYILYELPMITKCTFLP